MNYVNIEFDRVNDEKKGKARYQIDGKEYFAEQAAAFYYKQRGYKCLWSENNYWWMIMGLLFWDVIFAKVKGAVVINDGGYEENLPVTSKKYKELFSLIIKTNGIPADFFRLDFFKNRELIFNNRIKELMSSDVNTSLEKAYKRHFNKNFRMIEDWNRFTLEELKVSTKLMPKEILISLLVRILKDVTGNRAGLPDLLVWNENDLFLAEVKSKNDKLSDRQVEWHDYLKLQGIKVELCLINHTERQISNLVKKEEKRKKFITVSFGYSTSKKKEQALEFIESQPTYFTKGEGKNQIHGAVFDINNIENLFKILDFTSGWKTQRIEFKGRIVRSKEVRSTLWCFRKKEQEKVSADYCKELNYGQNANPFNCKIVKVRSDEWRDCGYLNTDNGEWNFNEDELNTKMKQIINELDYCPLFNAEKVKNVFKKLPKSINPNKDNDWAYISSDGDWWIHREGKWYNTWGSNDFPGYLMMVGIKKLSKNQIKEAISFDNHYNEEIIITRNHGKNEKKRQKSGCFIATAVYDSYDAPEVIILRQFRDKVLNRSGGGKLFIKAYYFLSPTLAKFVKRRIKLKALSKIVLNKVVDKVRNI